jgi:glycosyltransferase involved in cell wall biosynthesis
MEYPSLDRLSVFLPELHAGGAERMALDLAAHWASEGREVHLVCPSAKGVFAAQVPDQVRLVDLGAKRVASSVLKTRDYLRNNPGRPCWSFVSHMNVVLLLAGRILHRHAGPLAVEEVARLHIARDVAHPIRRRVVAQGVRLLYARADVVAAASDDIAADISRLTGIARDDIKTLENVSNLAHIAGAASVPVDHPWLLEKTHPVLVSVARLSHEKDHDTLLRAFALASRARSLRLLIVGAGTLDAELRMLARHLGIEHSVDFLGFQENPWRFVARADLLAMSSLTEAFGLALVEAMACGVNVVATDCGEGPRAILSRLGIGRLPPVRDPDSLAAAIIERLDHPLSPDTLREAARRYDVRTAGDRFLEVLAAVQDREHTGATRLSSTTMQV